MQIHSLKKTRLASLEAVFYRLMTTIKIFSLFCCLKEPLIIPWKYPTRVPILLIYRGREELSL